MTSRHRYAEQGSGPRRQARQRTREARPKPVPGSPLPSWRSPSVTEAPPNLSMRTDGTGAPSEQGDLPAAYGAD